MWQIYGLITALAFLVLPSAEASRTATPVQKVVDLLEKLKRTVQKEGKEEAAAYDKFACFCKEQADNKLYAISKSEEKIAMMDAQVKQLAAEIEELEAEVKKDKKKKEALEKESKEEQAKRDKAREDYEKEEEDLQGALDAIKEAIEALKKSKEGMENAKTMLISHAPLAKLAKSVKRGSAAKMIKDVVALIEAPGQPHAYEYQSNDIIATLQELFKNFRDQKYDLDNAEMESKNSFEMEEGARQFKIKSLKELIEQNMQISAKKSEEKEGIEMDLEDETKMMKADKSFMDDLTTTCEGRAKAWDVRSKTRSAELTALTDAIAELKKGVVSTYGSNKLALLKVPSEDTDDGSDGDSIEEAEAQEDSAEEEADADDADQDNGEDSDNDDQQQGDDSDGDSSFLQLHQGHRHAHRRHRHRDGPPKDKQARHAIVTFLAKRAKKLNSAALTMLVAKIEMGKDHFKKVLDLINDLIKKLEDQIKAEADKKEWCDKNMKKAMEKRDEEMGNIEDEQANIDGKQAEMVKLDEDISELGQELAELYKSLNEITTLREDEKVENEKTIADAEIGKAAVERAIAILKEFYEGGSFLQEEPGGGADREGKTVADLAPDDFEEDYKGKTDAGKGIIGLLEVIQSDYERTLEDTKKAEEDAQSKFEEEEGEIQKSIDEKKGTEKDKKGEMETTESDLVDAKEALKDAKTAMKDAKEELANLRPQCVDAALGAEQRKERIKEEIKSLKEAVKILEEFGK